MLVLHGGIRFDRERPWQHTEAPEGALLVGREQLIAPGDGRVHRLLPRR